MAERQPRYNCSGPSSTRHWDYSCETENVTDLVLGFAMAVGIICCCFFAVWGVLKLREPWAEDV